MLKVGLHYDVPEDDYHDDPCETPSLSSSVAHTIASKSALHAWTEHPRFGGAGRSPSKQMERGSIIHALLLGSGDRCELMVDPETGKPYENYRTKNAQALRDAARAVGRIPILQAEAEEVQLVADKLRERLRDLGVRLVGKSEVTAVWRDEGVLCRGRLDHLVLDDPDFPDIIYDLKTCQSAHPRAIQAHMEAYGYDIQAVAYPRAVEALYPEKAGRIPFRFIFCEIEPPFAVVVAEPAGSMRQLGEMRWTRARDTWRDCLATGKWPSYSSGVVRIEARPWSLEAELGEAVAA